MTVTTKPTNVSLKLLLIIPFTAIILIFVSVTGYLTSQNSQRAVSDVVDQLLNEVTNRTVTYFSDFLEEPVLINQTNLRALQLGFLDPTNVEELQQYLWELIQFHPQVTSIYFGSPDGGLLGSGREGADGELYLTATDDYKSGTFTKYAADENGTVGEILSSMPNFDARTRPWYQAALEKNDTHHTDPYVLFTGQDLAIATSLPVYDDQQQLIAVVSVDIFMSHADKFLQQLEVGKSGEVYVIDRNGLLVTSSTGSPAFERSDDGGWRRLFATENPVQIVHETAQHLVESGELETIQTHHNDYLDINGHHYFVVVTPFYDWLIVVAIPEDDFLGQIKTQNYVTGALSGLAVIGALAVGIFAVIQVRRPIDQLNRAAEALATGDWQQQVDVDGVREVQQLARSFNSMARQLRDAFEVLEERVRERTAELQTAKQMAESASRAKSDFLSNMSHELRTPLNAILGYSELLQRADNLTPSQKEGIEVIHQSGDHLLTLINDILDLSKVEAGKLEVINLPVMLPSFLRNLIQIMRMRAEARQNQLIYRPVGLPDMVLADERRLRQVLINLLSNAIKFTEKGSVELFVQVLAEDLTVNPPTSTLRFQVQDTGIGIPEDKFEQIFLPFEQLSDSIYSVEGTGLGLHICRSLVRLLGGELQVASRVGEGSTFWFDLTLPVVTLTSVPSSHTEPQICGYQGRTLTILVADDRQSNLKVMSALLQPLGFTVITVENGQQLLNQAQQIRPDLIITDLAMPVINGADAIQQLRQLKIDYIPVIAISAHEVDTRQLPSDDAMMKPLDYHYLLKLLQKHLHLQWVYRDDDDEPVEDTVIPPPLPVLLELRELLHRGNLRRVQEMAAELNPLYPVFSQWVETLARRYDEQKLLEFIDGFTGGKR